MNSLLEYFQRIAHNNPLVIAVELLLIGLFVYWVVSFLEGTRGERLFRGVITILFIGTLLVSLTAERFGLERIRFLYQNFLLAVLIIAVAAFQPELRRALIRIGQAGFLSGSSNQLTIRIIEELVNAINEMSAAHIGAIIVFERKVPLGEFVDTGVKIDSRITSDLLRTIFYPGSPLHDMAVVVHGDRIIAARVQLPLVELGSVRGSELGSRHRAAIGISNTSDALVIIVSEETGIVSIAEDGILERHVSESRLRKRLNSAFGEPRSFADRFKKPRSADKADVATEEM